MDSPSSIKCVQKNSCSTLQKNGHVTICFSEKSECVNSVSNEATSCFWCAYLSLLVSKQTTLTTPKKQPRLLYTSIGYDLADCSTMLPPPGILTSHSSTRQTSFWREGFVNLNTRAPVKNNNNKDTENHYFERVERGCPVRCQRALVAREHLQIALLRVVQLHTRHATALGRRRKVRRENQPRAVRRHLLARPHHNSKLTSKTNTQHKQSTQQQLKSRFFLTC